MLMESKVTWNNLNGKRILLLGMYVTSCRLIGSLKAVSIMFFVGTIFHVGIHPESFVKMVVTIGGGFNFSEI